MTKTIRITLSSSNGIGTLQCVGFASFDCGGMVGFAYPEDTTVTVSDKKGTVESREFVCSSDGRPAKMPYAVLWIGQRGVYIHEWPNLPLSHGCIHLKPGDAKQVYDWIDENTRIVFKCAPTQPNLGLK
jgi:hypothetical protein